MKQFNSKIETSKIFGKTTQKTKMLKPPNTCAKHETFLHGDLNWLCYSIFENTKLYC